MYVTLPQKSKSKECIIQPQESNQKHIVFLPQDLDLKCALHFWIVVDSRHSQVDNHIPLVHDVILDTIEKCKRKTLRRDFICEL